MEWNGRCGEQCQHWKFVKKHSYPGRNKWTEGRCEYDDSMIHYVLGGHPCCAPVIKGDGLWNFDMSKAPKDGTVVIGLLGDDERVFMRWQEPYCEVPIGLDGKDVGRWSAIAYPRDDEVYYCVPIAFARLNKPWE